MMRAEVDGDRLSHDELLTLAATLLMAGTDTTRNQLAAAVQVFCDHPDQWRLLAEHPELAPQAVEEAMRFSPVIFMTMRIAVDDVELGGVTIPAGTFIIANTAAANHDPAVYDEPDRFDITREGAPAMLTFGGGIHYCLGAHLARIELAEALTTMARRMPNIRCTGASSVEAVDRHHRSDRACRSNSTAGTERSPPALEPIAIRPTVRVIDHPIGGFGPQPGQQTQPLRLVRPQPARWPRTAATGCMPCIQSLCRGHDLPHRRMRIDQPTVLAAVGRTVQVFTHQPQPQVASELAGVIQYRTRQFAVVRPRSAVEVIAADARPDVVDDTDLRMHVHGRALVVLDVEHVNPLRAGLLACIYRLTAANHVGRQRQTPVHVGVPRHHRDEMQVGIALQRTGEQLRDPLRPQVLVFEVDQPPGAA